MPKLKDENIIFSADESAEGCCPICGGHIFKYSKSEIYGVSAVYLWTCSDCEAEGKQYEKTVFDGHEVISVPEGYIILDG